MATECYRIGGVLLNAGTQEVTRDGEAIPLPPLSFHLLLTLARNAPNVVTTRDLEEKVWSGVVVDRGTINKRVVLVRNALRQAGCEQDYIAVVRGAGYRLAVPVEAVDGESTAVESLTGDTDSVEAVTGDLPRPWLTTALVIGLLLVVAAFALFRAGKMQSPSANPEPPTAALARGTGNVVAVLPFENRTDPGGDAVLADGIAREIIGLLDSVDDLDVSSASSSFQFRDPGEPVSSIAAQLGVDSVVRGSVHQVGDRIIVMAWLEDARTGETLWTDSYDRRIEDVFEVQNDIAADVARQLQVPVGVAEDLETRFAATSDIEAFTLYLQGRKLMDDRVNTGAEGLQQALTGFEAAVARDPGFLRAHVAIASANFLLPSYDSALDRRDYLQRAEASARYALELRPTSPDALGVLAAVMAWRGEPTQAAALFERSNELGSRDPNVLHWHAMLFTSMGYFESLVPMLEDAYELDPLNPLLGCSLASSLNLSGRPEEAIRVLLGMPRFSRRDLGLALSSLYLGDYGTARDMLREIQLRTGVMPPAYAERLVQAFEDPPRRSQLAGEFVAGARAGDLSELLAFEALLIMGSPRAFDLNPDVTGTMFEHRLPEPVWNNWGVELRRDPRFKTWVQSLGYDRYWRKFGWPDRCKPTGVNDFECV